MLFASRFIFGYTLFISSNLGVAMDPITAAIVVAAAAGVAAGAGDASKKLIVDAYDALKALLKKKFGAESEVVKSAEGVVAKPDSVGRKETLKEEVKAAKADQDAELVAAAQALIAQVKASPRGEQIIATTIGDYNVTVVGTGNVVNINAPSDQKKIN